MKVSEHWLKEWINPALSVQVLADQFSNAGIEVESIDFVADLQNPAEKQAVLSLKIPPNRGDCLSMEGIAREISLLNEIPVQPIRVSAVPPSFEERLNVRVENREACPRYVGCLLRVVNNKALTPPWLKARLETAGIRSVSVVVDVLSYVMLELGQPLHAFDRASLDTEIVVRYAKAGEKVRLLDGQEIALTSETLVIADKTQVQAIAGVMGGLHSSVTENTTEIWLESAYFNPVSIRLAAKRYGIKSDASYRFERGVDSELQRRALERVVQLLSEITGAACGPIVEQKHADSIPKNPSILLRLERIQRVLGVAFSKEEILNILNREGFQIQLESEGFRVQAASFRQDITLEIDLIEEIARIHGLSNFPSQALSGAIKYPAIVETILPIERLKAILVDRGYCEAITYAFVDPKLAKVLAGETSTQALALSNPISAEMAVMRTSLLPGLVQALQYNQYRQSTRIRLFETGVCFIEQTGKVQERQVLSGICTGAVYSEQWGIPARSIDFYDIKSDVEALLGLGSQSALAGEKDIRFAASDHPAVLHPGQRAQILKADKVLGWVGAIHPSIIKTLGLKGSLFAFELDLQSVQQIAMPSFSAFSKFPFVRRDTSPLIPVDKKVSVRDVYVAIVESVKDVKIEEAAGSCLEKLLFLGEYPISIFETQYSNKLPEGAYRSLTFRLILQHPSRTLREDEVNRVLQRVGDDLFKKFGARFMSSGEPRD